MKLSIPRAALDQHLITFGKTGAGKSSKLRTIAEWMLEQKQPINILDPKGDWWGLKSSADGKGPGYPIVIFGGPHADVPINAGSGTEVAKTIFAGNFPSLIDMKGWMPSERAKFFIDYVAQIFRSSEGSRPIFIDECHNFAFKAKVLSPQAGEMLHWANRLASEGRGLGITLFAASQRPQKVHNDFSTSCETLVACKVIHKADRDAIKDWIDGCADPKLGVQLLADLANMQKPDAWVWSPEINFGPKKITFPMFETYDSFAPQKRVAKKLKGWAEIDLDDVRSRLATVIEQAQADDPEALRLKILHLEKALKLAQKAAVPRIEPKAASSKELNQAIEMNGRLGDANLKLVDRIDEYTSFCNALGSDLAEAIVKLEASRRALKVITNKPLPMVAKHLIVSGSPRPVIDTADSNVNVVNPVPLHVSKYTHKVVSQEIQRDPLARPAGQQKILDALEWLLLKGIYPATKPMLAALAGVRATSGGYMQNLANLAKSGLLTYPKPGFVASTEAGRAAANLPGDDDLSVVDSWLGLLEGKQREIFQILLSNHPNPVPKAELAAAIAVSPTSGGYMQNLADLNKIGALSYPKPGMVALSQYVMPKEI